jgi:hypothetical protein
VESWIDQLAEALGEEPLDGAEITLLLSAARDIAHRVERRTTPLAAFLLGTAAGRATAVGTSRDAALRSGLGTVRLLLPEAEPGEPLAGGDDG